MLQTTYIPDGRRRKISTIDEMINEIHLQFDAAQTLEKKAYSSRLYTGQLLLDLRKRVEAGEAGDGVKWWPWYETKFVKSRKDAEDVMRLANSEDPEAALEARRASAREGMRRHRAKNVTGENGVNVTAKNGVNILNSDKDNSSDPSDENDVCTENSVHMVMSLVMELSDGQFSRFDAWYMRFRNEHQKEST